ncbi:aminotransferase class I/II-fold pyridoxal phosphate-dependent enzyme [Variovorax sp. J22R115]|uniref:aminotransferase class I/II-fold pyridoxal phosphate-dependent enzyme n=1 Tax=Variovorax sp. J22R115 TaxID=3053509 RepID=UPI002575CC85|nr:aminotransferase class I/II-fold pyridoxal phosphate-dependent enzyme [Variovorax sp. J22R115]MDM0048539.1 aminotransferase class I/II-fold pyridoxal phosphate-dependent enzyme [Variovorax sp. J22R115]
MNSSNIFESLHGGTDAEGVAPHDFSTNANACGPCPATRLALQRVDAGRYPDPTYTTLRERLAHFHQVEIRRIVIAASASEFIGRITGAVAQGDSRRVWVPRHCYGDYLRAASAWRFEPEPEASAADLVWCCDPSSPLGQSGGLADIVTQLHAEATCVLDLAYEPLRLQGSLALGRDQLDRIWQLWTPNKALGLTGIRAAYAIAPLGAVDMAARLERLAPSWPLGAYGVALLESWINEGTQKWLGKSRLKLRTWEAEQRALCQSLGWVCEPSVANYFCAKPDLPYSGARVSELRAEGIKLRDTASFGIPGYVRLRVESPASQAALQRAWIASRS